MNKYEVYQVIKSHEKLVKKKRKILEEQIRDEQNLVIHQVLREINIMPSHARPFYAYFCSSGNFEIMYLRLDKHHWLKFTCRLIHASGMKEARFDTRILEHDFGEAFAHALCENYKTIVELIKHSK